MRSFVCQGDPVSGIVSRSAIGRDFLPGANDKNVDVRAGGFSRAAALFIEV